MVVAGNYIQIMRNFINGTDGRRWFAGLEKPGGPEGSGPSPDHVGEDGVARPLFLQTQ